jgi:tetratricopeptide (TPR) repeat protein
MALGAWVCGAACGALGAPTVTAALSKQQSKPPVKARLLLRVGEKDATVGSEVTLLGRDADVLLAQDSQSGSAVSRIDKARVVRCEFVFDYDRSIVATALQNNDWAAAVRTLSPAARLALPYLDLADNNGLELVLDLGVYMVSSADREMRSSSTNNVASRELALKQYDAAYDVFRQAGKAVWSPLGQVATLKGCHALLAQNKDAQAEEAFGQIDEPSPGDAAYGHYWLVQAELLRHAGKTRDALDAVVKSVVFANKDADTFPSALLLSADCYTQLGQHHRARDIYYEVAVLFVGTDWAVDALAGLKIIMDGKKTAEKEKAPLENVFFKVSDDMNKLSEELLNNRNQPKTKKGAAGAKDTE